MQEFGCEAANPYSLLEAETALNSDGSCHDFVALAPTAPPTPTPTPSLLSCSPTQEVLTIDLITDRFRPETKWTLRNSAGGIEMYSPTYRTDVDDKAPFLYETCVHMGGAYNFTIEDAYGDWRWKVQSHVRRRNNG
jgi:hypothetical protein